MKYSTLSYALAYANHGLAVFPLKPKGKTPLTANGFKDASKDAEQIKKWWTKNPNANIGIATGKASGNVFVIDLDEDDDKGVSGFHTLRDWERDNGDLPATINSITGRGGYHYFYIADPKIKIQSRIGIMDGIDIRGEGGYIVAPPSIHPNGRRYEWEYDFNEVDIATADAAVMSFLSQGKTKESSFKVEQTIEDGKRNGTLYSMACSLQAKGLDDATILVAVKMENQAKCNPPLDDEEVEQLVASALKQSKGEMYKSDRPQPVARQFITLKKKTDAKGNEHLVQSIENVETVLELDENLAGKIFFNALSYSPFVKGRLPWSPCEEFREWNNFDDSNLKSYLESNFGLNVDRKIIDGLNNVINRNRYNPVVEYLESFKWDGKEHIRHLLPTYLGVKDDAYQYEVMRLFMLGAISRAYKAGTKFDFMPVLVGEQGVGKSMFLRMLAGNETWYNDNFNTIEGDKATEKLRGMWIVELAELLATKRAKEIEAIKAFITSTSDSYRPPYQRLTEQRPRVCVFAGTTNNSHFLTDRTGNRRYLPITVNRKKIKKSMYENPDEVERDFQQAWAQALHIYKHEKFELVPPAEIQATAQDMQERFLEEDARIGVIQMYLNNRIADTPVCTLEVWEHALGMVGKPLERRASNELHDIMQHSIKGWERIENKSGGRTNTNEYGLQICYKREECAEGFHVVGGGEEF